MSIVAVTRPGSGQHSVVSAKAGVRIAMDFPADQATLERVGNDLVFNFEDNSSVRISGFYEEYTRDSASDFEVNGTLISGTEFFNTFGPDLAPAAGPTTIGRGSHYNEHGTSELAEGIGHLDGLDMSIAGGVTANENLLTSFLDFRGKGAGDIITPVLPPIPTIEADVRAVLYSGTGSAGHFVGTPVFFRDANGELMNLSQGTTITRAMPDYSVSCSFPTGWDSSWVSYEPKDGQLVFTFSAEGLNRLQSLGTGEYLRGFVTVRVTKDGHIFEYNVEVVGTNGTHFNSQEYDDEYGAVTGFGKDSVGEYHQGEGHNGSYKITSSTGDDEITLNDAVIGGSHIHASGSADPAQMADDYNTILLNKGMNNAGGDTFITSTDGMLTAHEGVLATGSTAHNNIDMGKGEIYIGSTAGYGIAAENSGKNTISGEKIIVEGAASGVRATGGGATIDLSSGADGKLLVTSQLESSTQEHFNTEKGGYFAASGISAYKGGQVSVTSADINVSSEVKDSSAHGTATAVYAGYDNAKTTINGYADRDNHMEFSASAPDHAMAVIGTNSGTVAINGGSGDDTIKISSEAKFGSSFGVAAQAGGQVLINGNGGHDELHIDAKFNGPAKPGTTELFDGNRGAYGMASAWGGAWVKVDGIETANITADARGSGGSAYGMYTHGNGWGAADGNIIKHDGSLQATISGYADNPANGHAMHASGGTNIIQGGSRLGDVNGDRITLNGHMTAAGYNGKNLVTTGDGDDIVTLNGNMTIKNVANDGMQNKIETGLGNDTVRVSGDMLTGRDSGQNIINVGAGNNLVEIGGSMRGVGANSITLGSGDSTVTLNGIMSASGTKGVNSIQGSLSGNIVVNVNGQGDSLFAEAGGKNTIGSVHEVNIASSIHATGNGTNTISNVSGEVNAARMLADSGGSNNVDTGGGKVVISDTAASSRKGMEATSGDNSITTGDGDVTVTVTGNNYNFGLYAVSGSNSITTENGSVAVTSSHGMYAAKSSGSNSVDTGNGKVKITSSSTEYSNSINAVDSGKNSITTEGGDVEITASGTNIYSIAMLANTSGSSDIKTGSGNVDITSTSANGYAYGMNAYSSGSNSIATESGNISVSVTGKGTGNINPTAGMHSYSSGINSITTESGTVTVSGVGSTRVGYGMLSSASNSITTGSGDVTVTGEGSSGYGMHTTSYGSNSITTESGTVTVTGKGGSGYGMSAMYNSSKNSIKADSGNVVVSGVGTNNGYGMHSDGSGSSNSITTGSGDVTVSGAGRSSYGMQAKSSGNNSITTESGEVNVSGTGTSVGYGMYAENSSSNAISSHTNAPLTVTITATATSAQNAIAMWAEGGGSVNYITGHSQAGTQGDSITLTANNGKGVAMQAVNGGKNIITTGAGNDQVIINGAVKGSGNEIDLGGGDNTLTINGMVQSGSLNVIANTGGTYKLILQASGTESFAQRYGQWLNNITSDGLTANGLTSISFDGLNTTNLPSDFLTTFNDLLHNLGDLGVAIEPPALLDLLVTPAAFAADTEVHESELVPASQEEAVQQEHMNNDGMVPTGFVSLGDSDGQDTLHDMEGDEPMLYSQYNHGSMIFGDVAGESVEEQGYSVEGATEVNWDCTPLFADENNSLDAVFTRATLQPDMLETVDTEHIADLADHAALDNFAVISDESTPAAMAENKSMPEHAEAPVATTPILIPAENDMQEPVEAAMRQMEIC